MNPIPLHRVALGILLAGVSALTFAQTSAPGPAFVDVKRSFARQRDAADEAEKALEATPRDHKSALRGLADASAQVRDRTVETLVKSWSDQELLGLASGLQSAESLTREGVADVFGRRQLEKAAAALAASLSRQKSEDATVLALWALGEIRAPRVWKPLRRRYTKERRSARIKGEALRALVKLDPGKAREDVDAALSDKLLGTRIDALELLAELDAEAAVAGASEFISNPPDDRSGLWKNRLLFAALDIVRAQPDRSQRAVVLASAVDAMIDALPASKGRARADLGDTLRDLCGVDLPPIADDWRNWWETHRENWTPQGAGATAKAPPKTAVVRYHGVPVDSLRVSFLLDTSGGMSRNAQGEFDGTGETRLSMSKKELSRVLEALAPTTLVDILTFASFYASSSPQPVPLGRARKKLLDFTAKVEIPNKPGYNRGNLYDALVFACDRPGVDTVYILTEGAPTEGKYLDYERFLTHFRRRNRQLRVRVHALLLGQTGARNKAFMERLAQESGGTFHEVEKQ